MTHRQFLALAFCLASFFSLPGHLFAEGGTSIVASKGQPAHLSPTWPDGVGELINDPTRTTGWNSWFSEWPNDVNQYALDIKSSDDLNRLISKLEAIKTDLRMIRLSYLKEPKGLGWVTSVPEGNGIPVIFSIGDQARINQWFKRVRKPFGVMEFTATPEAVPPTLTIFVQNASVKLDELEIPAGIDLEMGYAPTVFHKANTTIEQQREKDAESRDAERELEILKQKLDAPALEAMEKIEAFLDSRKGITKRSK